MSQARSRISALARTSLEELWFGAGAGAEAQDEAAKSLAAMVAKVNGVKPLDVAAQKLVRLSRDPDAPVAAIASVLEADAGLYARVLTLVNSAAFALRMPCKSAMHAVTLLGPRRVAELAAITAALEVFDDGTPQARTILEHGAAVAAVMKRLAVRCEMSVEDAITCGLLHDIGVLMQLQVGDGGRYAEIFEGSGCASDLLALREREAYGFDHGILGGCMLREWQIPAPAPEVVAIHHHAARAHEVGGDVLDLVQLLRLAERLVGVVTGPRPDDETLDVLARDAAATYLEIDKDDLARLWSPLHAAIEASKSAVAGAEAQSGVRRSRGPEAAAPLAVRPSSPPAVVPAKPAPRLLGVLALALALGVVGVALGSFPAAAAPIGAASALLAFALWSVLKRRRG